METKELFIQLKNELNKLTKFLKRINDNDYFQLERIRNSMYSNLSNINAKWDFMKSWVEIYQDLQSRFNFIVKGHKNFDNDTFVENATTLAHAMAMVSNVLQKYFNIKVEYLGIGQLVETGMENNVPVGIGKQKDNEKLVVDDVLSPAFICEEDGYCMARGKYSLTGASNLSKDAYPYVKFNNSSSDL